MSSQGFLESRAPRVLRCVTDAMLLHKSFLAFREATYPCLQNLFMLKSSVYHV